MLKEDGPKLHPAAGKVSKYVIICTFMLKINSFYLIHQTF